MKKITLLFAILFFACTKEEAPTGEFSIIGRWDIIKITTGTKDQDNERELDGEFCLKFNIVFYENGKATMNTCNTESEKYFKYELIYFKLRENVYSLVEEIGDSNNFVVEQTSHNEIFSKSYNSVFGENALMYIYFKRH